MKWMLLEARTVLRDGYLFMRRLMKDELALAVNFTLKRAAACKTEKMCVFGNRADGVCLGSSKQFASSISDIVYTRRHSVSW